MKYFHEKLKILGIEYFYKYR